MEAILKTTGVQIMAATSISLPPMTDEAIVNGASDRLERQITAWVSHCAANPETHRPGRAKFDRTCYATHIECSVPGCSWTREDRL